jgi:sec-independent protein translocase protein TatA
VVTGLGTSELLILFAVLVFLFGAAKLPDLARGSGRALRIFKSEVRAAETDRLDSPARADDASSRRAEP